MEVKYDHMEGARFRHTTQFVRWRPDREPGSCTYAQLEEPVSYDLAAVLGAGQGELRSGGPRDAPARLLPPPQPPTRGKARRVLRNTPGFSGRTGRERIRPERLSAGRAPWWEP